MLIIFFNLAIRDDKPFTRSGNPCLLKAPPRPISAQEAGVIRGPETGLQVFGSPSEVHGTFDTDSTSTPKQLLEIVNLCVSYSNFGI